MVDKMWELLTTFTEESQKAALDKCAEKGFDVKRGLVSLDESFINLFNAKNALSDAIEKRKLIQLPVTVQKALLSNLESVSRSLTSLINGTDEVQNLSDSIEQLNVSIWQYGLHNLSDEVLGFLEKMNQLKTQEVEISSLRREVQTALKQKKALEALFDRMQEHVKQSEASLAVSLDNSKKTSEQLAGTTLVSEKAAALLAAIQQNDTVATQLLSSTKTSNAEVLALEPKIKEFYSQIDQHKIKMNATATDAQNAGNVKSYV